MFGCTFYFCFAVHLPIDNWHFVNNAILMIYFQNVSPVFEITRARSYLSVSWLTGYLTVIITFSKCLVRVIGCFMFFSLSTCKQVLRERLWNTLFASAVLLIEARQHNFKSFNQLQAGWKQFDWLKAAKSGRSGKVTLFCPDPINVIFKSLLEETSPQNHEVVSKPFGRNCSLKILLIEFQLYHGQAPKIYISIHQQFQSIAKRILSNSFSFRF